MEYNKNSVKISFTDGKLTILTDAMQLEVSGRNGFIENSGQRWVFSQPDELRGVTVNEISGRSADYLSVDLQYANFAENWYFFPSLPFFCTQSHPDERVFRLDSSHIQLTTVEMTDRTDHHDSLVHESVHEHYKTHAARGNMFLIDDYAGNRGLLIVKHSPCPDSAVRRAPEGDLCLDTNAHLRGCGYGAAYGVGDPNELFDLYKELYRLLGTSASANFIMSNTWGDRSRDKALKEDFVLRELDCAANLGVDIVQLDDGWQKGMSSNSVNATEKDTGVFEGFWAYDPDFWVLDPVKFPGGMDKILEKADSLGIEMGLWFAPDSADNFSNWQKDVEVIRTLTEKHGARYIKLDGVVLRSDECEKNYLEMLDTISRLDSGNLRFNLDITNDERLGYFCGIPYGTLFVENRYTDWKNYYPHRTMRNLWQLSRYLPASKFQFEVLNPRRNAHLYGDDPLAPDRYDIDWCFASVMAANPLIWMEMQHLSDKDTEDLKKIIAVYRRHRDDMAKMTVSPIGELPNGVGWSGFLWKGENCGYITVFRGITEKESHTFDLPMRGMHYEVLCGNTDAEICENARGVSVTLSKKRGYTFVKYTAE